MGDKLKICYTGFECCKVEGDSKGNHVPCSNFREWHVVFVVIPSDNQDREGKAEREGGDTPFLWGNVTSEGGCSVHWRATW